MRTPPSRMHDCSAVTVFSIFLSFLCLEAPAQVNNWTKPTSGNWEEPYWSLGRPPAFDDRVIIGNPGWKAVQISGNTVQNFPDSLNVYSIDVTSPVDSFNTLLLNYAGFDRPLTVNYSMTIGSGAALTMHASALRIQTPTGVGLSIGGEANQNDDTLVTGNQADVGWVGPGVYNLNSGILQLEHFWIGGPHGGVFNQNGGNNATRIVHLTPGGVYNFRDGEFYGEVYFTTNTTFRQDGGRFYSDIPIFKGQYILNSGLIYGNMRVPVYAEYTRGDADVFQNGGTNLGSITLGGDPGGYGRYTLSNGIVQAPGIGVGVFGQFHLVNGTVSSASTIGVSGDWWAPDRIDIGLFTMDGGFLSSPGISIDTATFEQNGGTNRVGDLKVGPGTLPGEGTIYTLNGGLLTTSNTFVPPARHGGFFQNGGTHSIANELSISADRYVLTWRGYVFAGGVLMVPNITISDGGIFTRTGGTLGQSGILKLAAGNLVLGTGTYQFGAVNIGQTNSSIIVPSSSCILRFRDSSGIAWAPQGQLIISNWNGSYVGGGSHQVIFGNSAAALTAAQVREIFFRNPGGGLSPGLYSAKILATGEIVPDTGAIGRIPPRLAIRKIPTGMRITLTGEAGYNYSILRSDTLAQWSLWTNGTATSGTWIVVDPATSLRKRFYRAVLVP